MRADPMTARGVHRRRRAGTTRGSVLLLVPAGILVVLVLAALAVDLTHVHLARRTLHAAAAAAAGDAATAALDEAHFRASGEYRLDPVRAQQVVVATLDAHDEEIIDGAGVVVDVAPTQVTVRLEATVRYLFAPPVPGSPSRATVSASATARAAVR